MFDEQMPSSKLGPTPQISENEYDDCVSIHILGNLAGLVVLI